jgi:hypothetical protein
MAQAQGFRRPAGGGEFSTQAALGEHARRAHESERGRQRGLIAEKSPDHCALLLDSALQPRGIKSGR